MYSFLPKITSQNDCSIQNSAKYCTNPGNSVISGNVQFFTEFGKYLNLMRINIFGKKQYISRYNTIVWIYTVLCRIRQKTVRFQIKHCCLDLYRILPNLIQFSSQHSPFIKCQCYLTLANLT